MTDFGIWVWIALFYEIGILGIFSMVLALMVRHYRQTKKELIKIILFMFIFFAGTIFFNLITTLMNAIWGGVPVQFISSNLMWFVSMLHAGRFGLATTVLASIFGYIFSVKVFGIEVPLKKMLPMLFAGILIIGFSVIAFEFDPLTGKSTGIYDLVVFILVLGYICVTYFPFMIRAFALAQRSDLPPNYAAAVRSLGYTALCLMLIFLCVLLDEIMLFVFQWTYSVFLFAAWIFALLGLIWAYLGYVKPQNELNDEK